MPDTETPLQEKTPAQQKTPARAETGAPETTELRQQILETFVEMGKPVPAERQESIVTAGLLDSMSILELVNALEERFDLFFEEEDLTLENFDKLSVIESLVTLRLGESQA